MALPEKVPIDLYATFLDVLREGLSVSGACRAVGIGRSTVYERRDGDPDFARAWDAATREGEAALDDQFRRLAAATTERPVFVGGKRVGTVREYSDTLTIFLGDRPPRDTSGTGAASRAPNPDSPDT